MVRHYLDDNGEISKVYFTVTYREHHIKTAVIKCTFCKEEFDAKLHGRSEHGWPVQSETDLKHGIYDCPHCKSEIRTRRYELVILREV